MTLGIAILSYNHPDLTARTLRSVLALAPAEVVHLIHNGSRGEVAQRLESEFPSVNHHVFADNRGYSGGVNRALRAAFAHHDWVLLVTNDTELISLASQLPAEPALVAPLIWLRRTGRVNSLGGAAVWRKARLEHCQSVEEWQRTRERYVPGTAFYIHRELFFDVGEFDESLHTYWEDVDFSRRAAARGWRILVDESTQLRHGVGKTCHRDPFYTSYLFQRNRRRISRKYVRGFAARAELEFHLATDQFKRLWRRNLGLFNKASV